VFFLNSLTPHIALSQATREAAAFHSAEAAQLRGVWNERESALTTSANQLTTENAALKLQLQGTRIRAEREWDVC
jgi:hypothetical protein